MNILIDGVSFTVPAGLTALEAARANGIDVPSLCWHPRTGAAGRCRACLVEVEGVERLKEACALEVREGMSIRTATPRVLAARRLVVELLLAGGGHDCLSCQANGACELQSLAYRLGIERPAFLTGRDKEPPDESSEGIIRDLDKCILCGRCVASCGENVLHEVLDFAGRGARSRLVCDDGQPMGGSTCVQCGECVQVCPVGALVYKRARGKARPWETEAHRVVCPYCGVGCLIDLRVKDNRWMWSEGVEDGAAGLPNRGMLCVKGRFGFDYVASPDRLTTPFLRQGGELRPATWEEALSFAAARLAEIKSKYGPRSLGVFSSAKVSNEENYALMRLARGVLGTNSIDHCARLCHASSVAALSEVLGSGSMTNSLQEAEKADVIFVTGSNTTWGHPVFGGMIRRAVKRRGVKLIVADPRRIELAECADIHLRHRNGTDIAVLMGLQHVIVRDGLHRPEFIRARCEGWDAYLDSLAFYTPATVESITGIPADALTAAARLYASAGAAAIYFGMGVAQHAHGVDNVRALANLALITGNIGREGTGINPLRGQVNVQGASDMGALPNVFTGYQPVTDPAVRAAFAAAWGADPAAMDSAPGLTMTEMVAACGDTIRGLYIIGENPMVADPNLNHAEKMLRRAELIIVQDIFLTETAQLADVVLPSACSFEKTGTYTNSERRVQISRKALDPPGQARPDSEIIADLAARLGAKGFPAGPEQLYREIRNLTPSYRGITYERIAGQGLRWPCPDESHPGTPILHAASFPRGKAKLSAVAYVPPAEEPDSSYPFRLNTGRLLQHYHTGSMSRRSEVLSGLVPRGMVEVHPVDAACLGLIDGEIVRVSTRRGTIDIAVLITPRVAAGAIFIPFHFAEAAANRLTLDVLDPLAKIPEYKVCAARLDKIAAGEAEA
ncbi:MAG: formate dehydrogenase subunit alpha [Candidatus Aminicenantes bacterium]|nr:formate dehydrogenase subunit alpha [Candidatus Aminicenantes bacterium]